MSDIDGNDRTINFHYRFGFKIGGQSGGKRFIKRKENQLYMYRLQNIRGCGSQLNQKTLLFSFSKSVKCLLQGTALHIGNKLFLFSFLSVSCF